MAAHRYWRIKFDDDTANFPARYEFDMWEVLFFGGYNQALASRLTTTIGGTAISGEEFSGSYIDDYAFDSSYATEYATKGTNTFSAKWIGWDFGSGNDQDVKVWGIVPYSNNYTPTVFGLEYSDNGSSWTRAQTITKTAVGDWGGVLAANGGGVGTAPYGTELFTYQPGTGTGHRYWRMKATGATVAGEVQLKQLNFKNGGSILHDFSTHSFAGQCYSTTYLPRYAQDKATSGNFWDVTNAHITAGTAWIAYDFGTPVAPTTLEVVWSGVNNKPSTLDIEYSDDGTTWVLDSSQVPSGSGSNITNTYTITGGGGGGGSPSGGLQMLVICS